MKRYKAQFSTTAETYLYFEVGDDENPGEVLDQLLESGELEVPAQPEDTEDFTYDGLMLEGWTEE